MYVVVRRRWKYPQKRWFGPDVTGPYGGATSSDPASINATSAALTDRVVVDVILGFRQ